MAEKIFCRVCGAPKGYNWATCGTPACRRKHRAAYKAEHQRRRAAALIAAGRCVRCKSPIPARDGPARDGEGGDCPKCLAKKRAYAAKRARVKKRARDAEKKRIAAVIRLTEVAIARRRRQQELVDRGEVPSVHIRMPHSLLEKPLPAPIQQVEI